MSQPTRNRATAAGPAHNSDTPPTLHGRTKNAVRRPCTSLGRSIPDTQSGSTISNRTIYRPRTPRTRLANEHHTAFPTRIEQMGIHVSA